MFTWNTTEPHKVQARQMANPAPVPQSSLHDPQTDPEHPTDTVSKPEVQATTSTTSLELLVGLPAALDKATPDQKLTAQKLLAFASSGQLSDIRDLSREDIHSLTELLTTELDANTIATTLESQFGLPAETYLAYPDPAQAVTDLIEAVRMETDSTEAQPLVFTDRVEDNGTVSGDVHVLPVGAKRVYAAFENQGSLQGLDRVLAVWRNPADDRMVFTEFEPVRTGSTYNYVWLELEDGWPAGFYKLDLFHPNNTTQLLASRSFNVR